LVGPLAAPDVIPGAQVTEEVSDCECSH
jgi:hypothetical protein